MTKRTEALSIGASVAGIGLVVAALALAFHPSVALGFSGAVLALGGVGWKTLRDAFKFGTAGVEVERKRREQAPE